MSDINSVGKNKNKEGKRTKESQDVDKVIILSRMLREVITVKVPFEQRPGEVREQAMRTFGGILFQDEGTAALHCEARVCLSFWENGGRSNRRKVREFIGNYGYVVPSTYFLKNW